MAKSIECKACKGAGWVTCCDPPGHMCPGTFTCHVCEGAGRLIKVEVLRPYFTAKKRGKS